MAHGASRVRRPPLKLLFSTALSVVTVTPSPGPSPASSGFDASSFFTGAAVATVLAAVIGAVSAWRRAKKERADSLEDQRSTAREDAVRRQLDAGQELQAKAITLAEAAVLGYAGKTPAEIAAPGTELAKAWEHFLASAKEAWTTLGAKDDELTPLLGAVNGAVKGLLDAATAEKVDALQAGLSLQALSESVTALGQRAQQVQQTKGGSE